MRPTNLFEVLTDESSSCDSDDDIHQLQRIQEKAKANVNNITFGTKIRATLYDFACCVTLVQLNEKERQVDREQIVERSSQLLALPDDFYNIEKKLL